MAPGQVLRVRLRGEEPLRNVPRTAREQGHEVLSLETDADGESHHAAAAASGGPGAQLDARHSRSTSASERSDVVDRRRRPTSTKPSRRV